MPLSVTRSKIFLQSSTTIMPSVPINYTKASQALTLSVTPSSPYVISTPFGLSILEIQGLLILPSVPKNEEAVDPEHAHTYVKINDIHDAVKFGKLLFDEKDPLKVVLFVGTSQRLNGTVEKLREPLAVLRIQKEKPGSRDSKNGTKNGATLTIDGKKEEGYNEVECCVKGLNERETVGEKDSMDVDTTQHNGNLTNAITMVDIIHKKIIFKHRPLPIM